MSTRTLVASYVVGLVALFGAALGVGHLVGPLGTSDHPQQHQQPQQQGDSRDH